MDSLGFGRGTGRLRTLSSIVESRKFFSPEDIATKRSRTVYYIPIYNMLWRGQMELFILDKAMREPYNEVNK